MDKIQTAAILIGGEGTRLRPLTINKPKALAPVVGTPLLKHMLLWLKKYGIKEIIFILFYQKEKLRSVFGNGSRFGLNIKYVEEDVPRGTGGALRKARKLLKNTTVVLNGDILTDINIAEIASFHRKNNADMTITLVPVEDPTAYGLVKLDEEKRIKQFLEKPKWEEIGKDRNINAGIYVMEPHIIDRIPNNKIYSLERDLFPLLLNDGTKFYGYPVSNVYWIDMGTPEKYRQTNYDILEGKFKVDVSYKKHKDKIWLGKHTKISKKAILRNPVMLGNNTFIADNANIGEFVVIGNNCKIGNNVHIERSILWDNVEIGDGARLIDCILADNCRIEKFARLEKGVVLGSGTKIPSYSIL